jgi:integrase
MASYIKRKNKKGKLRWTVLVRKRGHEDTRTFPTKAAGEIWARARELAIDTGTFVNVNVGTIFADLVNLLIKHGLEPAAALTEAFWRKHALARMAEVASQTAAQDLLYASVIVRHASDSGIHVDRDAPSRARAKLRDHDNLRVTSRARTGRISDDELGVLLAWIDANAARTHVPLGDIVRFALATAMRRGEILNIKREDLQDRVILVHNRKHPRDHERVDRVPLLRVHAAWPRDDPLEIIKSTADEGRPHLPLPGRHDRLLDRGGRQGRQAQGQRRVSPVATRVAEPLRRARDGSVAAAAHRRSSRHTAPAAIREATSTADTAELRLKLGYITEEALASLLDITVPLPDCPWRPTRVCSGSCSLRIFPLRFCSRNRTAA